MIPAFNTDPPLTRSLASLNTLLKLQLTEVDACIFEKMQSSVPLISQIAHYLISLGEAIKALANARFG